MSRIPMHTIEDAPPASRSMLEHFARQSRSVGRVLNLHAQLAHAPIAIAAYHGMRRAFEEHAALEPRSRTAVMLAASAVQGCAYTGAIHSMLAQASGWGEADVAAIRSGTLAYDGRLESLLAVARAAAGDSGRVPDVTWNLALAAGWTPAELLEAYTSVGLTLFTGGFTHFAGTALDVPARISRGAAADAPSATPQEDPNTRERRPS